MITDMFGKEFNYLDYVIYLRNGEPQLAKVIKIVISNTQRLVCRVSSGYMITIKKFDMVEIITESQAKAQFPKSYMEMCNWKF